MVKALPGSFPIERLGAVHPIQQISVLFKLMNTRDLKGIFNATTICLVAYDTTPAAYVLSPGQAVSSAFDEGEHNGVWHCKIRKAPAVPQMLK